MLCAANELAGEGFRYWDIRRWRIGEDVLFGKQAHGCWITPLVTTDAPEAGSYDCFILEETITTKSMMMKEVEKIKSWYAYGIGLVKEVTYDKHGKLISTMILNEIADGN